MEHKATKQFLAPECVKAKSGGTQYYSGKAVDIWALGMTFFCCTFNNFPFEIDGVDIL